MEQCGIAFGGFIYIYFIESNILRTRNYINILLLCRVLSLATKCLLLMSTVQGLSKLTEQLGQFVLLVMIDCGLNVAINPPSGMIKILSSRAPLYMEYIVGYTYIARMLPCALLIFLGEESTGRGRPVSRVITHEDCVLLLKVAAVILIVEIVVQWALLFDKMNLAEEEHVMARFIDVRYLWTAENETDIAIMATKMASKINSLPIGLINQYRSPCCMAFDSCWLCREDKITISTTRTPNGEVLQRATTPTTETCNQPSTSAAAETVTSSLSATAPPLPPPLPPKDYENENSNRISNGHPESYLIATGPNDISLIIDPSDSTHIREAAINLWNKSKQLTWYIAGLICIAESMELLFCLQTFRLHYSNPRKSAVVLCLYICGLILNHFIVRNMRPLRRFVIASFCLSLCAARLLLMLYAPNKISVEWLMGFSMLVPIVVLNYMELFYANLRLYVHPHKSTIFKLQKYLIFYGANCIAFLYGVFDYHLMYDSMNHILLIHCCTMGLFFSYILTKDLYLLLNMIYRSTRVNFLLL